MRQPLVLDAVKAPQIDSDVIPVLRHIEPRAVVHARKQPPADHRVQSRRSVAPGNELPPPRTPASVSHSTAMRCAAFSDPKPRNAGRKRGRIRASRINLVVDEHTPIDQASNDWSEQRIGDGTPPPSTIFHHPAPTSLPGNKLESQPE